jgi:integrase
MPKQERFKTKYPGVYFIEGLGANGKPERIYYLQYRRGGRLVEEKAGRQFQDDMTPARAAQIRSRRIQGGEPTNQQRREARKQTEERYTISRLWEEYKATHPEVKALRKDEDRFKRYLKDTVGLKVPMELVPLDVDRLRLKLQKTLKPATVRNALELLRRIVNFGVKKHLCQGLSFTIQMPKVNNLKTEDLTPEELTRLLQAIDEDENRQVANIMKMALVSGMRKGEILKLRWQDIDFERGFIHILDPKGKTDQVIPLNDAARQVLKRHPRPEGSDYVFPGRDLHARRNVHRVVNRIKSRAGLPTDFRPLHGLRHVYASMLASSGQVDMYTLQKLLTHKSPMMTQRYAHLRDDALKRASNLAGEILAGIMNEGDKSAASSGHDEGA